MPILGKYSILRKLFNSFYNTFLTTLHYTTLDSKWTVWLPFYYCPHPRCAYRRIHTQRTNEGKIIIILTRTGCNIPLHLWKCVSRSAKNIIFTFVSFHQFEMNLSRHLILTPLYLLFSYLLSLIDTLFKSWFLMLTSLMLLCCYIILHTRWAIYRGVRN